MFGPSAALRDCRIVLSESAPWELDHLAAALVARGHRVARFDGTAAALIGDPPEADLLLLRVPGPSSQRLELLRRLRAQSRLPCILVTSRADSPAERVIALEIGADDCFPVTATLPEMLARCQALMRRNRWAAAGPVAGAKGDGAGTRVATADGQTVTLAGGWQLSTARRALVAEGQPNIRLTGAEFELLRLLAEAGGNAVDRDVISRAVFRRPWKVEDRAVDGLVKRLRKKLTEEAIATVRGQGYALVLEAVPAMPPILAATRASDVTPEVTQS